MGRVIDSAVGSGTARNAIGQGAASRAERELGTRPGDPGGSVRLRWARGHLMWLNVDAGVG